MIKNIKGNLMNYYYISEDISHISFIVNNFEGAAQLKIKLNKDNDW